MFQSMIFTKSTEPRIITDNGSQFISNDFRELTSLLEIEHTFTSPAHPQSNGKLERFQRTLKSEHIRASAYFSYEDAKERMGRWIKYYNENRLHAAKRINSEHFEGRTVGGIDVEMRAHWYIYKFTGNKRAKEANIGGINSDTNARIFE